MTLRQAIQRAGRELKSHGIESANLTAEVLLCHALQITKVRLYQDLDEELPPHQESAFQSIVKRHVRGEPVAYITGHKEFYGLDFIVDNSVLIPRPETELLVEKVLEIAGAFPEVSIADIGTGSGAIAIVLALNVPQAVIYAVDIFPQALQTARINAARHKVAEKICFLEGDLLDLLPGPVDLIVANLPYVKETDLKEPSIRFEPEFALNGGPDGLTLVRRFVPQIAGKLKSGGSVLMEIGLGQSDAVKRLLREAFPGAPVTVYHDFSGIERVVRLTA